MKARSLIATAVAFRLFRKEARALIFACLSVALGIALALSIRIATEHATRGFSVALSGLRGDGWVGPVLARTTEAREVLRSFGAAFALRRQLSGQILLQYDSSASGGTSPVTLVIANAWSEALDARLEPSAKESTPRALSVLRVGSTCPTGAAKMVLGSRSFSVDVQALKSEFPCELVFGDADIEKAFTAGFLRTEFYLKPRLASEAAIATLSEALEQFSGYIPGFFFQSETKRLAQLDGMTRSFRVNLQIMGTIALLIGLAMVRHVFAMIIARNAIMFAILNANGIAARKFVPPLLVLAGVLGLAAGGVGAACGAWLAQFISAETGNTLRSLYDRFAAAGSPVLSLGDLFLALGAGAFASIVGAYGPIASAGRLSTAKVLRGGFEVARQKTIFSRRNWLLLGFFGALIAVGGFVPLKWEKLPLAAFVGCIAALGFNALLSQFGFNALHRVLPGKTPSQIYCRSLFRIFAAPGGAVAIQVLSLGFALTLGVRSMAESFRHSLENWVEQTIKADIWIRSAEGTQAPLPDALITYLKNLEPGKVRAVDTLDLLAARLPRVGKSPLPVVLSVGSFATKALVRPLVIVEGPTGEAFSRATEAAANAECDGSVRSPCPAIVSESLLLHAGARVVAIGKPLVLEVEGKTVAVTPFAVHRDFGSDLGIVMIDERMFFRIFGRYPAPFFANIYLTSGSSHGLLNELRSRFAVSGGIDVFSASELRSKILTSFEKTFRITDQLYLLSIFIAFISVSSSLALQIMLRRREWSVLWATALPEKKLFRGMLFAASGQAAFAALFSIAGGIPIALLLVYVVNRDSFGYRLAFQFPWVFYGGIVCLAALVGAGTAFSLRGVMRKQLSAQTLSLE